MGATSIYTTGYSTAASTEPVSIVKKAGYTPIGGMPIIIYCHSAGGHASEPTSDGVASFTALIEGIVNQGFLFVSAELAGPAWANDTALARVTDAVAYARANGGVASGPVYLMGASMGGATAMVWAKANPDKVKKILTLQPVCSMWDMYTNNRAGVAAAMFTAYGGAWSDGAFSTHSPELFVSTMKVPQQLWSSDQDNVCIPSKTVVVTSQWGNMEWHHGNWGDHGTTTFFNSIDQSAVMNFLTS